MAETSHTDTPQDLYALVAEFSTAPELFHAAEKCRDEGFSKWDCLTPLPLHGLDGAMGLPRSKVPRFTLLGGLTGFTIGTVMVWFMNAFDYPLIVGGKPYFSPVFPFPIMYELTILLAAFGTLGGMCLMNLLPRHHHPLFEYEDFVRAGEDAFFVVVERSDPKFDESGTRAFLEGLGAAKVDAIHA